MRNPWYNRGYQKVFDTATLRASGVVMQPIQEVAYVYSIARFGIGRNLRSSARLSANGRIQAGRASREGSTQCSLQASERCAATAASRIHSVAPRSAQAQAGAIQSTKRLMLLVSRAVGRTLCCRSYHTSSQGRYLGASKPLRLSYALQQQEVDSDNQAKAADAFLIIASSNNYPCGNQWATFGKVTPFVGSLHFNIKTRLNSFTRNLNAFRLSNTLSNLCAMEAANA